MSETTHFGPASCLQIPELAVVVADHAFAERVFAELAFETTVLAVFIKGGSTERANASAPSLGTARQALLGGQATGVQIHYAYQGEEWWATLEVQRDTVRFVRVRRHTVPEE